MAARGTMSDIIAGVRDLIFDTATTPDLDDDTVQRALDRNGQRVLISALIPANRDLDTGNYTNFLLPYSDIEDRGTATVVDSSNNSLSFTLDNDYGIVVLDTAVPYDSIWLKDVYVYDIYASACELILMLIMQIRKEYTFSSEEGNFQRSDRINTLETAYKLYKERTKEAAPTRGLDYTESYNYAL